MTHLRRWLIVIHRYLGIPLGALFVVWFASGIVMMYAGGMPTITPETRLSRRPALDLSRVRVTPAEAAARGQVGAPPTRASLSMVLNRPAYRFDRTIVFADTGQRLDAVPPAIARAEVSRFLGVPELTVHYVDTLVEPDQWSLTQRRQLPLHRFRVDDDAASEVYVSPLSSDVMVHTTRRSRALAWVGTIPHWLYFAALRVNQPLWYQLVVWASTLGCILAIAGLALGLIQFRWRPAPVGGDGLTRRRTRIPYRGWMRWHYVTGVVFGVFTFTWVFSGLLSMEPYAWTTARGLELPRDTFTGGALELGRFPGLDPRQWRHLARGRDVKEVTFLRIHDDPYFAVRVASTDLDPGRRERLHQPYYVTESVAPDRLLVSADTLRARREPFSVESVTERLVTAVPNVPLVETTLLSDYDAYYYSRARQRPLPVLRVKFADPAETWAYIDPETSRVLTTLHRSSRLERWLFNGLHSLDFGFWYDRRPLWDIVMIGLSVGGLVSSGIGLWIGIGRVWRVTRSWMSAV